MYIDHVGIVAETPARTIAFYQRLLGGSVEERAGHIVLRAGSICIAVSPRAAGDPERIHFARGQHLAVAIYARDQEAVRARLADLDHQEVGGRIYVRDPDGFVVELVFV